MFQIIYHTDVVEDDIPRLPPLWREKIQIAITEKLTMYPEHFGKPLQKTLVHYRRLRVGDYRVIFRIDKRIVKIFMIENRKHVYQKILTRLFHGRT